MIFTLVDVYKIILIALLVFLFFYLNRTVIVEIFCGNETTTNALVPDPKPENTATCIMVIEDLLNYSNSKSVPFEMPPDCDDNIYISLIIDCNIQMSGLTYLGRKLVSFYIFLSTPPRSRFNKTVMKYKLSIVNARGQKCLTQKGKIKFPKNNEFREVHSFLRDDLLNIEDNLLDNGKLTVHCEAYLVDSILDESTQNLALNSITNSSSTFIHDYNLLFESERLSDLVLVLEDGTEFKVHKSILSVRCAVFGAMFEYDTMEKQQNRIQIEDISAEVCRELLRYIYTNKVENLDSHALDLLIASERYQLEHFKSICEQHLCCNSNLTTDSVAFILRVADMHRAQRLKAKCIDYIRNNEKDVKETDGWKMLVDKQELVTKIASRKNR